MQRFLITPEVDKNFLAHFDKLAQNCLKISESSVLDSENPHFSPIDFAMYRSSNYQFALDFAHICAQNGIKSILNILDSENFGAFENLISEFSGVHLKSKDFAKISEFRSFLDSQFSLDSELDFGLDSQKAKILGFSAHKVYEIKVAISQGANYCFLSPIFATPNKGTPLGVEIFQNLDSEMLNKTFALGGIVSDYEVSQLHTIPNLKGFASIRYFAKLQNF